ncbi:MAG: class I SAM-dependent methyltransferase [Nannocystaceae bacterium]
MADGIVGNHFDKYDTTNPIERNLTQRFLRTVGSLYASQQASTALEVGCGEGRLADHLVRHHHRPQRFVACDLSLEKRAEGLDADIIFRESSIYALPDADDSFDLVLCCEVLEHLEEPAKGLAELTRVARKAVLISTPREPLWRFLNMARGKYWANLGNTPDHVQHFSKRALIGLAATELEVLETRTPVPWTVVLGRPREQPRHVAR